MDRRFGVRLALLAVLAVVLAWRSGCAGAPGGSRKAAVSTTRTDAGPVLPQDAVLEDAQGRPRTLASLRGEPFLVSLVFTRCPSACPRVVSALKRLEGEAPGARFVLITLDPEHDTPAVLADFARERGLGERWTLLRPDTNDLARIARMVGVGYGPDSVEVVAHSAVIAAVDSVGHLRERRLADGLTSSDLRALWEVVAPPR
jgi:protein SCO1/2